MRVCPGSPSTPSFPTNCAAACAWASRFRGTPGHTLTGPSYTPSARRRGLPSGASSAPGAAPRRRPSPAGTCASQVRGAGGGAAPHLLASAAAPAASCGCCRAHPTWGSPACTHARRDSKLGTRKPDRCSCADNMTGWVHLLTAG
eukprot:365053-Chlamydomonas_euryale.AAC.3